MICEISGERIPFEVNVTQNPGFAILEITVAGDINEKELIEGIQNLNYETLYLSKRDKLRIVVKKHNK